MDEKKIEKISVNIDAVAEANILEKFFPVKSDGRVNDLDIFNIPPRSVSRAKQIISGEKESNEQTLKDIFLWARLSEKRRYEISEQGGLTHSTKQELFKICTKLHPTFKSYGLDISLFEEDENIADKIAPFIESFASNVARTAYSLGLLQLCVYEPMNEILTEEKNRLFTAKNDIQGEIGALHEYKAHLKRDILLIDEAIYRTLVSETKAKLEKWKAEDKNDFGVRDLLLYDVQRLVAAGLLWADVLACFNNNAGYFDDNSRNRYGPDVYESMKHIRKEGTRKKPRVTEKKLNDVYALAGDIEAFNLRKDEVSRYLNSKDFKKHDSCVSPKYRALTRINELLERKRSEMAMLDGYSNTVNAYIEKQSYETPGFEAIQSIPVIFVADERPVDFRK